jgi:hypothetical protein
LRYLRRRSIVEDSEIAVIVHGRLRKNLRSAGNSGSFVYEQKMVAVDEACCIAFAAHECSYGFPLTADVISVFAAKQIELEDSEIPVRLKPVLCDKV